MEELVTCEGTVHSVIFQNAENGYTVLRLLTEEGEVITVVGCIPCVAPGEHLTVSGVRETHPQHGEQVRAVELERSLPEDEEEIFSYLPAFGGARTFSAADIAGMRISANGRRLIGREGQVLARFEDNQENSVLLLQYLSQHGVGLLAK